jgi:hypothetical protein
MEPQDLSWRRLPGPGEPAPEEARPRSRDRGIRHVRRLSNWTAVVLVAATAVTAGYFARASAPRPVAVTGAQSQAPSSHRPCVTAPVATSGGSGVTTTTPNPSCATGTNGTRPAVVYARSDDGRGD